MTKKIRLTKKTLPRELRDLFIIYLEQNTGFDGIIRTAFGISRFDQLWNRFKNYNQATQKFGRLCRADYMLIGQEQSVKQLEKWVKEKSMVADCCNLNGNGSSEVASGITAHQLLDVFKAGAIMKNLQSISIYPDVDPDHPYTHSSYSQCPFYEAVRDYTANGTVKPKLQEVRDLIQSPNWYYDKSIYPQR